MREYDPNHRYQVITCASADFTDEDMSFRTVAEARTRIAYLVKEYAADGRDLDGAAIFDRKANCCTHHFGCAMLSAFSVDVAARSTPRRYPDMPAASTIYYFIYCKGPGDQHFTLCDPWGGRRGMNKVFAPRITKDQADKVVARMTERNPGFTFQRRPAR